MNKPLLLASGPRLNHSKLPPIVTVASLDSPVAGGVFLRWKDSILQILDSDSDLYISSRHVDLDPTEDQVRLLCTVFTVH
jgi:hypothetical protein